jgi:hypothetical protein
MMLTCPPPQCLSEERLMGLLNGKAFVPLSHEMRCLLKEEHDNEQVRRVPHEIGGECSC